MGTDGNQNPDRNDGKKTTKKDFLGETFLLKITILQVLDLNLEICIRKLCTNIFENWTKTSDFYGGPTQTYKRVHQALSFDSVVVATLKTANCSLLRRVVLCGYRNNSHIH